MKMFVRNDVLVSQRTSFLTTVQAKYKVLLFKLVLFKVTTRL